MGEVAMFGTLSRLTAWPRIVLGIAAAITIGLLLAGRGVSSLLLPGGNENQSSQSYEASQFLQAHFPGSTSNLVLLVSAPPGQTVSAPAVAAEGQALTSRLSRQPSVTGVRSYWQTGSPLMRSADGRYAVIDAKVLGSNTQEDQVYNQVSAQLGGRQGDVTVQFGGEVAVDHSIRDTISADLGRAELVALPITLVILVLVFGSLIAALLPLMVGIITIVGTDAVLRVLTSFTSVSVFSLNLTTALGLGLAIDYALLLTRRFREEQRRGLATREAVRAAVCTAGRTIAFSALTVAVALSSMLVFPLFILRSFSYAGISVVLFAAVTALTVVPAALTLLGHRVNSLDLRRLLTRSRTDERRHEGRAWHWLTALVMGHARLFAIGVTGILIVLLLPFLNVQFGIADYRQLPASAQPRAVQQVLADDFPASPTGVITVLTRGASPAGLADYTARVSGLANVSTVTSAAGSYQHGRLVQPLSPATAGMTSGDAAYLSVVPAGPGISPQSEALVRAIRAQPPVFSAQVAGDAATVVDTQDAIGARLPLAVGIIAVATLLLIFLLTGSILVPLLSVLLSALSLTAMLGAVVWVFQDGHGSGLLGFTSTGFIDVTIPVLMFCVAFGLSMDYSVFLISRIRERYDQVGDNRAAVSYGIERTGGVITAAALILAVVLIAVGTSRVTNIKMLGLGVALAVLVDAMVVRCLLAPAVLTVTGRATWWAPGPLRRFQERFGIREADSGAPGFSPGLASKVSAD
jgi:putative drug exporter of the RND superfamily